MRFYDENPYGITSHNTGGEHVGKHMADPGQIDAIRQDVFGSKVDSWDTSEVRTIMFDAGRAGELVNAFEVEDGGRWRMIGGALVRYNIDEGPSGGKHAVLDASDIVIENDDACRGRGLGTALVSRALQTQFYGQMVHYPEDITITDRNSVMDAVAKGKLVELGFSQGDDESDPKMLLGGIQGRQVYGENQLDAALEGISDVKWTGYMSYFEHREAAVNRMVYRKGEFVGSVQSAAGGLDFDADDRMFQLWDYLDRDGKVVAQDVQQPTNEYFAVSDMVNRIAQM